jgi:hypothetical protein
MISMLGEVERMPVLGIRDAKYKVNHFWVTALCFDNSRRRLRMYRCGAGRSCGVLNYHQ